MSSRPKRKVTYSLPEDLVSGIAEVVSEGAAPSYSAFVEEALTEGVRKAREEALARAFEDAAADRDFLDDIGETMSSFSHVDNERVGEDE